MDQFIKDNFNLLLVISFAWVAAVVLASVVYRAIKEKRYPAIPEHEVRFTEKWASGASQKNLLTKLGGARNCLSVTLSNNALIVHPMFPFNLMFLPEAYDLEHFIPRSMIRSIQPDGGASAGRVLIEFESGGRRKRIELVLRKREEFLRAANA